MTGDIKAIARALGGEVNSGGVSAPGPGHSKHDRSMRLIMDPSAPHGFRVHSFSPSYDWREGMDYVKSQLGLSDDPRREHQPKLAKTPKSHLDDKKARIEAAKRIWADCRPVAGTPAEIYLRECRGIALPKWPFCLRYSPQCPVNAGTETLRLPALVAAFHDVQSNVFLGVHRTFLEADGKSKSLEPRLGELVKRMLGKAEGAAIKLTPDEEVTGGLGICEGIETGLSLLASGWKPVWAVMSANGIADFEILSGVESLTIWADDDETGIAAAKRCAARWLAVGNDCEVVLPPQNSNDWNDWVRA